MLNLFAFGLSFLVSINLMQLIYIIKLRNFKNYVHELFSYGLWQLKLTTESLVFIIENCFRYEIIYCKRNNTKNYV